MRVEPHIGGGPLRRGDCAGLRTLGSGESRSTDVERLHRFPKDQGEAAEQFTVLREPCSRYCPGPPRRAPWTRADGGDRRFRLSTRAPPRFEGEGASVASVSPFGGHSSSGDQLCSGGSDARRHPGSLGHEFVSSLLIDDKDALWIGTEGRALNGRLADGSFVMRNAFLALDAVTLVVGLPI